MKQYMNEWMSLIIVWPFFLRKVCTSSLKIVFFPLENFPCDFWGKDWGEKPLSMPQKWVYPPLCHPDLPRELARLSVAFLGSQGWGGTGEGCSACRVREKEWRRMCSWLRFSMMTYFPQTDKQFSWLVIFFHLSGDTESQWWSYGQISVLLPQILLCETFKVHLTLPSRYFFFAQTT